MVFLKRKKKKERPQHGTAAFCTLKQYIIEICRHVMQLAHCDLLYTTLLLHCMQSNAQTSHACKNSMITFCDGHHIILAVQPPAVISQLAQFSSLSILCSCICVPPLVRESHLLLLLAQKTCWMLACCHDLDHKPPKKKKLVSRRRPEGNSV